MILYVIILALLIVFLRYCYMNLHYDRIPMFKVRRVYNEQSVALDDGTTLNYVECKNDLQPLLLIHGQTMCWEDYANVLLSLKEKYHVYAIDCHGHGKSSHDELKYTCKFMGNDFKWFIENVIGDDCIVCGHSSGGIIAAWLTVNVKDYVKGVVFEDPPFFRVKPNEMKNTFVWHDGFEVVHKYLVDGSEIDYDLYYILNGYFWNLFGDLRKLVYETARKYRLKHQNSALKVWYIPYKWLHGTRYLDEFDLKFAETFYSGGWMEGIDIEELLSDIECPSIYLKARTNYGKDGVLYAANTDEDASRVVNSLKDTKLITIKSGHDIHFEQPTKFVNILFEFIEQFGDN